jgi:ribosomal protein S27AE
MFPVILDTFLNSPKFDGYTIGMSEKPRPGRQERACGRCGDSLIQKYSKKHGRKWYCGYCDSVVFGEPDPGWLPFLLPGEKPSVLKHFPGF